MSHSALPSYFFLLTLQSNVQQRGKTSANPSQSFWQMINVFNNSQSANSTQVNGFHYVDDSDMYTPRR